MFQRALRAFEVLANLSTIRGNNSHILFHLEPHVANRVFVLLNLFGSAPDRLSVIGSNAAKRERQTEQTGIPLNLAQVGDSNETSIPPDANV